MLSTTSRYFFTAIITSLLCTALSFTIHVLPKSNSMINFKVDKNSNRADFIANDYLSSAVKYHKEQPTFSKRPLTTFFVENLSRRTNLNIGWAFTMVNFGFYFISGILLFYCSFLLGNNIKLSIISVILFFLSFTVLFAFFRSIYTYDEPIQYCFLFLSLIAVIKEKWILYIFAFSIALISRENSILLAPSIFVFLSNFKESKIRINKELIKKVAIQISPILIYLGFYLLMYFNKMEESANDIVSRTSLFKYNFQNILFANETMVSLFLAVGIQILFLYFYMKTNQKSRYEKQLVYSFLLAFFINTIIVIMTARAREARLFALPLIFLWPLLGKIVYFEFIKFRSIIKNLLFIKNWIYLFTLIFLIFMGYITSEYIYIPSEPAKEENFFNEYLFTISIIGSLLFVVNLYFESKLKFKKSNE